MDRSLDPGHTSQFPQPRERFATYLIQTMIDEDRVGRIYKAFDESFQRLACLRILSPELTRHESFIDVLRIQLQSVSALNHAGLAQLYELSTYQGLHYMASEWCSGAWLSQDVLTRATPYTVSEGAELMIKCCETLQVVSQKGIFHGNLRLNTILLYPEGDVKIMETGLVTAARALFGPKNLTVYLGSARFFAPELTIPGPADFRADIYTLGLIYYFLLFGVIPFRYEGQQLNAPGEKTDIDNLQDALKVISKMTESNPAKRYQDYSSLLGDLHHLRAISITLLKTPAVPKELRPGIKNQKLFRVLCALYASGASGVLTVSDGETRRNFYLRNREFIYFESNVPQESIWQWLIEKKEIAETHKPSANENLERSINRILGMGLLRIEDFKYRYQELTNRVLTEVVKNPSREASFAATEIQNEALTSIRLSDLLLRTARYSVDFSEVTNDIKPETHLHRTGLFEMLVSPLSLTQDELFLVSVSQDGIYTGAFKASAGSAEEKGLRFLYLLKQIGALEVRSADSAETETENRAAPHLSLAAPLRAPEREPETAPSAPVAATVNTDLRRIGYKLETDRLDQEAERRFNLARESFNNGKYWEAANLCETALGLHEDGRYYWLMGMAYAQHPRFRGKADDCFHRAINLDPLNDELHVQLAEFFLEQGLPLRARTHCQMALQIIPRHEHALEILSRPQFKNLGAGGCCCEHEPGCNHEHH